MNTAKLLHIRLHNQLLTTHSLKTPQEVVSWMGAMQSQSLDLAKWAIGVRLENKSVLSCVRPGILYRHPPK